MSMSGQDDDLSSALNNLVEVIASRTDASPDSSYTAKLLSQGATACSRKFAEEAIEFVLAVVEGEREEIAHEAADVMYHLLVALRASGVEASDVARALESRRAMSGLEEKASRSDPERK